MSLDWKDYAPKAIKYSMTSFPMFEWKGINFELHGFVLAMIIIDVFINAIGAASEFYKWVPLALFRNVLLFTIVLLSCFIRIKYFGEQQLRSYDQQQQE